MKIREATQDSFLTLRDRLSRLRSNRPTPGIVMIRTGIKREWHAIWRVQLNSGVLEKEMDKDSLRPYRKPTLVPWAKTPRRVGFNPVKGIRQIGFVPSEEGVPATCTQCGLAGRSDKGDWTV